MPSLLRVKLDRTNAAFVWRSGSVKTKVLCPLVVEYQSLVPDSATSGLYIIGCAVYTWSRLSHPIEKAKVEVLVNKGGRTINIRYDWKMLLTWVNLDRQLQFHTRRVLQTGYSLNTDLMLMSARDSGRG